MSKVVKSKNKKKLKKGTILFNENCGVYAVLDSDYDDYYDWYETLEYYDETDNKTQGRLTSDDVVGMKIVLEV